MVRKIAVDVGANSGSFSAHVLGHSADYEVIAIEPNQKVCGPDLNLLLSHYPKRLQVFPIALSSQSGRRSLRLSSVMNSQLASLLNSNPEGDWPDAVKGRILSANSNESLEVDCYSVSEFLVSNSIRNIDFLKIDTQGTDLEILEGFLENSEVKVAAVEVEIDSLRPNSHYIHNLDQFEELNRIISKFNLKVFKIVPNGIDTQEYNFFLARNRVDFISVMSELRISESPTFSRFWSIIGTGGRVNENLATAQRQLTLKVFSAFKHPFSSYKSLLYKLTR